MRVGIFALLLVVAGCGGGERAARPSWSAAVCQREAGWIADHGLEILRQYGPGQVYPADVAFIGFRNSLSRFEEHGCEPATVGEMLGRRLTSKQRAELLGHLPARIEGSVRRALAEAHVG